MSYTYSMQNSQGLNTHKLLGKTCHFKKMRIDDSPYLVGHAASVRTRRSCRSGMDNRGVGVCPNSTVPAAPVFMGEACRVAYLDHLEPSAILLSAVLGSLGGAGPGACFHAVRCSRLLTMRMAMSMAMWFCQQLLDQPRPSFGSGSKGRGGWSEACQSGVREFGNGEGLLGGTTTSATPEQNYSQGSTLACRLLSDARYRERPSTDWKKRGKETWHLSVEN